MLASHSMDNSKAVLLQLFQPFILATQSKCAIHSSHSVSPLYTSGIIDIVLLWMFVPMFDLCSHVVATSVDIVHCTDWSRRINWLPQGHPSDSAGLALPSSRLVTDNDRNGTPTEHQLTFTGTVYLKFTTVPQLLSWWFEMMFHKLVLQFSVDYANCNTLVSQPLLLSPVVPSYPLIGQTIQHTTTIHWLLQKLKLA